MVTVGLDEVGRGCWAGPLVAAAVAISDHEDGPRGLRDSKKLSRLQRERLDEQIRSQVKAYGVGWVSPSEIDSLGLTKAVQLAMLRAMKELHKICSAYDELIIDGNYNFFANATGLHTGNVQTAVRADDTYPAVSAASIVAKVARDNYMREIAQQYPAYGFDKHVGYGTAAHLAALKRHGVTDVHRRSFRPIQSFSGHLYQDSNNTML